MQSHVTTQSCGVTRRAHLQQMPKVVLGNTWVEWRMREVEVDEGGGGVAVAGCGAMAEARGRTYGIVGHCRAWLTP